MLQLVAVIVFCGTLLQDGKDGFGYYSHEIIKLQSLFFVEPFCKAYQLPGIITGIRLQSLFFVEPFCKKSNTEGYIEALILVAVLVFCGTLLQV